MFLYVLGKAHVLSCHGSKAFAAVPSLHLAVRESRLARNSVVKVWLGTYNGRCDTVAVLLRMMSVTRALFSQNPSGQLTSCELLAQSDWRSWLWVCWVPVQDWHSWLPLGGCLRQIHVLLVCMWKTGGGISSVHMFHWCIMCETGGGISSYANNTAGAGRSLVKCLDSAKGRIPTSQHGSTPVYLGATAGMRLLQ